MARHEQMQGSLPETSRASGMSRRQLLLGLGGIGLALGGGIYWWRSQPVDHDYPRLTPAQAFAAAKAKEITLVDIRTPGEWRQTGLPEGGVAIDMRRDDFLQALSEATAGNLAAPVALICARGVRSARMTRALAAAGYSRIIDVPEGMLGSASGPGWIAGNLPVTRWRG
ncbi:rhodanese-like domain-containing protein [Pseudophaeobacter sp.]|uniref:rhodanese-like domain-containing protein n=2 Tax=Pseudophaeobacter sp. TaxID=1971739 RepID=UPI00329A4E0A